MTKKRKPASQERARKGRHKRKGRSRSGADARSKGDRSESEFFSLGAGASQRTILAHLRKSHRLAARRRSNTGISYFDSFDWRIHAKGRRVVVREQDAARVFSLEKADGSDSRALSIEKAPCFAADLPPGALRDDLEKLVKVRRLVPVAGIELTTDHYAVLDDEEKTIVRLIFERAVVRDPAQAGREVELPATLRIVALRGYRRAHAEILGLLSARAGLEPVKTDLEDRALKGLGCTPTHPVSGIGVHLDPEAPTGAAFVEIHRALYDAMKLNEPGIRADLDTEYLHEYRVAARRARVLHRVFRSDLRDSPFEDLVPRIKWLRSATGPTRDLDVQLLELSAEREALGNKIDALIPLESLLREHRHAAWQDLVTVLDSTDYAELRERASALLDPPDTPPVQEMSEQGPPLGPWASQRIARAARKLLKDGRKVDEDAEDAQLHELRLDGKKLRYLIEFFASIYPENELEILIRELKKLQDNLGDFNDACVRGDLLRALASELDSRGPGSAEALVAVGRLVERTEERKRREHDAFARRFERFDTPKNRARLRSLFGSGKKVRASAADESAVASEGSASDPPGATEPKRQESDS